MLLLAVLGLVLGLGAADDNLQIVGQRNYNLARLSGPWYTIFMASDNMTRIGETGDLRLYMRHISLLRNGSLKFDFLFMVQGECVEVVMVCEKTDSTGEFSVTYDGDTKVLLLETDYTTFVTFYMQNIKNGTVTHVLGLYGRIPGLSKPFLKRFEHVCKKYGLGSQNILNLGKKDVCLS
ncbi:epididymal-specific lipocalin-9 [Acomys russatus]|uniref:epididymal-specific lipocalin-9 n=1 Tax=Acomys russatus TaxID=60746 RepID=UPI0021E2DFB0|nr:epididymal-specific lipocalin-9 [Acomys russatus]